MYVDHLNGLTLSSPRGAWAFDELRTFHTRPSQFNWGPKNLHFGRRHFMDLYSTAQFKKKENLKNYQAQPLYVLAFFTAVPKNSPKNGQNKVKKVPKNDQIVSPTWRRSFIIANAREILLNT